MELEVQFEVGKARLKRISFSVKVVLWRNNTDISESIGLKIMALG